MIASETSSRGRSNPSRLLGFLLLWGQLVALLVVVRLYRVDSSLLEWLLMVCLAGGAIHYWLPARYRHLFAVVYGLFGYVLLLGLPVTVLVGLAGLLFFGLVRSPMPWWSRIGAIALVGIAFTVGRTTGAPGIPDVFWPVLGSVFMFRLIVYLYDARHASSSPRLLDFLGYFFLLPNACFLLFPVVDHATFLGCRDRRPLDEVVQTGIRWIGRGVVQLVLYRFVDAYRPDPAVAGTVGAVAGYMVLTYLLYLRISGQFHIAIGLLHLFGYDLPETNRRYLLASSVADFWRRINIYWKDFILKVFYLPVFFRLRSTGETKAAAIATAFAFLATWLLHAWQSYWLLGSRSFTLTDTLFWGIFGGIMVYSAVRETRRDGRPSPLTGVRRVFGIVRTFILIVVLWSLWQTSSLETWWSLVTLRGGS